ncbi:hypothetical protein O4106_21855 [Rhodococcus pyridinivorans]|uniref:hypothetical protein n=1 Tax=Rhodococcus pyridinivorans TaxID=103816 RepID=UPI0022B5D0C0|nr:hypothetical protein [Rhodococcus pyridinivorans]MCZ4649470.1 hypothetical protein [Rhodococcus pyridinivorans]
MSVASVVAENVPGYAGPATLYKIDPPIKGTDHLIVYYQPPLFGQQGQLCVILATEHGAVFGDDVRPQQGTYVTNEPNHYLALQIAGGYLIQDPAPEPTQEEILVQQPPDPIPDPNAFDPSAYTVTEVNSYLSTADQEETARVMEAERAGKARKGILGKDVV